MRSLLVSSGEPAGIGPDLCLALAGHHLPVVVLGDKYLLAERAHQLNIDVEFIDYQTNMHTCTKDKQLIILHHSCKEKVVSGETNPANARYVIDMLEIGANKCLEKEFLGFVTAPVHKGVINQAGIAFTGHTEFLANHCKAKIVVMMLASEVMKIALVTTHLPLKKVPEVITTALIIKMIQQLHKSLQNDFNIMSPSLFVLGLNPHAGEGGYLGREEIEIIIPAINELKAQGLKVEGPFSADTVFTKKNIAACDAFVTMYHDQGLPVLKYASFGESVNITLGLPIIRTSVDHGTALELAGGGLANPSSLFAAVKMAATMAAL